MSETCPACSRRVGRYEARCARCGTGLLGVEIEGVESAMTGAELPLGRAAGERTRRVSRARLGDPGRRRRVVLAATAAAVAVVVGALVVSSRRSSHNGAASTTTIAAHTVTTATNGSDGEPTTSTSVDRRETRADDGTWVAGITRTTGTGPRVGSEHTGLTMVSTRDGQTVEFDNLDTGVTVSVAASATGNSGGLNQPVAFAGGAVMQLNSLDPPSAISIIVYVNGDVRSPAWLGATLEPWSGIPTSHAPPRTRRWFVDRTDHHLLHLVDLATATQVRSVTLPALATPAGVQGDDPVVVDPAGRAFVVAADGMLSPATVTTAGLVGNFGPSEIGRRVEIDCDAGLTSCVENYVGEDGRRTPLLVSSAAVTTGIAVSPAGRHLAALYPRATCDMTCRFGVGSAAPTVGPLEIVDVDRGPPSTVIGSTQTRTGGFNGGPGTLTWSTDGAWLFFTDTAGLKAWRPNIAEALLVDLPSSATENGGFGFSPVFIPTPSPPA